MRYTIQDLYWSNVGVPIYMVATKKTTKIDWFVNVGPELCCTFRGSISRIKQKTLLPAADNINDYLSGTKKHTIAASTVNHVDWFLLLHVNKLPLSFKGTHTQLGPTFLH